MNLKYENDYLRGKDAEGRFASLVELKGWLTETTSRNTDIYDHIDLYMTKKVSVDVKSTKRVTDHQNDNYHWVEIKNVHGKNGWLYGKADFFAFETVRYWILVSRKKLIKFVESNTIKEYVEDKKDAIYRLYTRNGRSDVITLVKSLDLMAISDNIFHKNPLPQPKDTRAKKTKQKTTGEGVQIYHSTA